MDRTMRQQVPKVIQLHQKFDRKSRMLAAQVVGKETQWLGMKEWLEVRETKWIDCHMYNVEWGMGITEMAMKVQANHG